MKIERHKNPMKTEIYFLKIMTKNKKLTRQKRTIELGLLTVTIALLSVSCGHLAKNENESLIHAKSLIWSLPDSSKLILEKMDTVLLSENDKMQWNLIHEHASFRLDQRTSSDTTLQQIADFFIKNGQKQYAGEALYVKGAFLFKSAQYYKAIQAFKEAELFIPYMNENEPYQGMIYLMLGHCYETECLYHIAHDYYLMALPNFEKAEDHYRLSSCYRDIGRTLSLSQPDNDSIEFYFNRAYEEARMTNNSFLPYDILIQKEITAQHTDSAYLYSLCSYAIDSLHQYHYLSYVGEYLVARNELEKVKLYIDTMAQMYPTFNATKRNHYLELVSKYHAAIRHHEEAYNELYTLYANQQKQLQEDARVRTYAIARQYDLEREQEKTLRLTIERQRLWIMIAMSFVLVMLIVGIASGIILRQRHRTEVIRRQQEKAEMERYRETAERRKAEAERQEALAREETKAAKIRILEQKQEMARTHLENLRNTLSGQQEQLRKLFVERVQFIAKLKQERDIHHRPMPEWLAKELDRRTLTNPEEWKRFEDAFKTIFGNILFELPSRYPKLTKEDLRFLTLYIVGLDNESIGILMQQELRTLWNRKQKIKDRINENDLDGWIEKEVIETVIRRQLEEK